MQEPRREPSSYFSFSNSPPTSTRSSTPVSPITTVHERPNSSESPRPPIRRTPTPRSISEYTAYRPSLLTQTIEEDTVNKVISDVHTDLQSQPHDDGLLGDAAKPVAPSRRPAALSAQSSPAGKATSRQERGIRPATRFVEAAKPRHKPKPGHVWARTSSGSVWYERLKGSSGQSNESSDMSAGSDVPKHLLTPLRPPMSPSASRGPPYRHQVIVEKSFTNLQAERVPTSDKGHSCTRTSSGSKRSSVNPFRLFSSPLQLIRKLSLTKPKPGLEAQVNQNTTPAVHHGSEMRGHKSLLKRTRTSEALRQVTSILHDTALPPGSCSPVTVMSPLGSRQMSNRSGSSEDSGKRRKQHVNTAKDLASQSNGKKSMQDLLAAGDSFTTSQLELRMGAQPNNTPDERATYKIKRSPSAESEEFLKVDISIRGGTSYLPSEARRIHTPPLPQEGPNGKRRGFFFDYNAPKASSAREPSQKPAPRLELPAHIGGIPRRSTSVARTVHEQTFGISSRSATQGASVARTRTRTSDWYDIKLAELDTSSDEDDNDHSNGKRPGQGRGRSPTTKSGNSLEQVKKRKDEENLDYNIPEHLPNSPLCPRHPRYWRVVQGRGSQFRGCWMHGIGVWGEGEGKVAGVSAI